MPLRVPSPETPVITWLSPNKGDQGLVEIWATKIADYIPLDIGASHPNTRLYPNFKLGKQSAVQSDDAWVIRIWVSDETSPDWFNYALKYSGEDNAFPIFIRTYRELKATYQPRAKQSSLGAFYKLVLDNPGSGFTNGTLPEVTFDSESATPALAHGVVSPDGTLAECVLDFCGDGYTGNVAFTVDAPANGNPASGTAYIQPASAILVKEEANLYPEDSEFYAQYFQVVRVYETIPGPTFQETSLDVDGATLTTSTTRKLCSGISTGEAINTGVWCKTTKKSTDIDFICEEVIACRAIPGLPMYSTTIDAAGDTLSQTKTMVVGPPTLVTSITTAGGVYTKTFAEEMDGTSLVSWKVVQVKATQNELDSFEVSIPDLIPPEFRGVSPLTTTEQTLIGTASSPTLATGDIMRREAQIDFNTYRLTISGRASVSLPKTLTDQELTEEYGGGILNVVMKLNTLGSDSIETGLLVVTSEVKNLGNGLQVRTTKTLDDMAWPLLTEYDQDPETQSLITTTYQVVDATMVVAPSIVNGVITRYKRIDQWRSIEIIETYSLPADYEEQRFMAHQFPSLWDYTTYNYSTACGPTGQRRQGFSTFVQARLAISFTTTKQTITGLTLIPNTIQLVHDRIDEVLNDAGGFTYSGTCSGPITWTASDPDFTTYTGTYQGTEQLISGESVLWRAGLYKNSSLYVTML